MNKRNSKIMSGADFDGDYAIINNRKTNPFTIICKFQHILKRNKNSHIFLRL